MNTKGRYSTQGVPWTTEEVMNDFGEFFATAVDIVGLLTKDDEY